jgi:hypothetical protein
MSYLYWIIYFSQSQAASAKSLVLIGQVQSQSAWVFCHNNHLKLFQPIRAQEEIIYRRLKANHKFNMEPLEIPRKLTTEYVWSGFISYIFSRIIQNRLLNTFFLAENRWNFGGKLEIKAA